MKSCQREEMISRQRVTYDSGEKGMCIVVMRIGEVGVMPVSFSSVVEVVVESTFEAAARVARSRQYASKSAAYFCGGFGLSLMLGSGVRKQSSSEMEMSSSYNAGVFLRLGLGGGFERLATLTVAVFLKIV